MNPTGTQAIQNPNVGGGQILLTLGNNNSKQTRGHVVAKGTLRTGPMMSNRLRDSHNSSASLIHQSINGSLAAIGTNTGAVSNNNVASQSALAQQPNDLNIKATQLTVNPSKIVRVSNRPNIKTTNSQSSSKNVLASKESSSSLR